MVKVNLKPPLLGHKILGKISFLFLFLIQGCHFLCFLAGLDIKYLMGKIRLGIKPFLKGSVKPIFIFYFKGEVLTSC